MAILFIFVECSLSLSLAVICPLILAAFPGEKSSLSSYCSKSRAVHIRPNVVREEEFEALQDSGGVEGPALKHLFSSCVAANTTITIYNLHEL